jgi:hypothetical protein
MIPKSLESISTSELRMYTKKELAEYLNTDASYDDKSVAIGVIFWDDPKLLDLVKNMFPDGVEKGNANNAAIACAKRYFELYGTED